MVYRLRPAEQLVDAVTWDSAVLDKMPGWFDAAIKRGRLRVVEYEHGPRILLLREEQGEKLVRDGNYVVLLTNGDIIQYTKREFEEKYALSE